MDNRKYVEKLSINCVEVPEIMGYQFDMSGNKKIIKFSINCVEAKLYNFLERTKLDGGIFHIVLCRKTHPDMIETIGEKDYMLRSLTGLKLLGIEHNSIDSEIDKYICSFDEFKDFMYIDSDMAKVLTGKGFIFTGKKPVAFCKDLQENIDKKRIIFEEKNGHCICKIDRRFCSNFTNQVNLEENDKNPDFYFDVFEGDTILFDKYNFKFAIKKGMLI